MLIGAHVSAAGGLSNAVANAQTIGVNCLQIFGASPRQWTAKQPSPEEIKKYQAALSAAGLGPVFLHAAYLVNLGSPNSNLRKKSVESLTAHLKITNAIGAEGLIFHVGSSKGTPPEKAVKFIIEGVKQVLKNIPGNSKLILENDAGGGAKVGDLKQIGQIIKTVKSSRLGVCYDTAHGFESGLINEYTPAKIKTFLKEFDRLIGLKHLIALHVNDSKTAAGSHHDRHANIGEGFIGLAGFRHLAKVPALRRLPWILEVPGFDGNGPDQKNIDILKKLF